jgi:hypothetical protein
MFLNTSTLYQPIFKLMHEIEKEFGLCYTIMYGFLVFSCSFKITQNSTTLLLTGEVEGTAESYDSITSYHQESFMSWTIQVAPYIGSIVVSIHNS